MDEPEPIVEVGEAGRRLRLTRVSKLPPGNPGEGDLELLVCVESFGFAGEYRVWIEAGDWKRFQLQLQELEERRQGEARVASMSPEEFDLTVRAIDRAGHMGVIGRLSRFTPLGGSSYSSCVQFAFEISPSLLPDLVRDCASLSLA